MATINLEDLSFKDFDGFCNFLRTKLNWHIKEDLSKESLTYEFLPEELRIEEKQLRRIKGDSICQLIPFTKEQPWGIFLLELNDRKVYTTFLRQILRGLVPSRRKPSTLPTWQFENLLFICTCNYEDFTFAHFKGEKYQKAKLSTFGWTSGETRLRTLCEFNLPPLFYNEEFKYNPQNWLKEWSKAFDKEKLTKEFFDAYKFALEFIKKLLLSQNKASSQKVHSFAQQLLSRIMFLYFVEKKGWLKWKDYVQDKKYVGNLWEKYKKFKTKKDTFYSLWLSSLFFQAFNKKHGYLNLNLPEEIKESFNLMPFLNGGLFTENEFDKIGFNIPDEIFELLFEIDDFDKRKGFLERYNFTIREDTPFEVEVAVDPEMLGKVYESLISEEERGKTGIFYTPRTEIDYMCRLSLVEYLFEKTKMSKKDIIPLIFEPQAILKYDDETNLKQIKKVLEKIRILDPAVGSASFLVGMMNVLIDIQKNLSLRIEKREENLFALKNKVISENLYGVDVKDWAVMVGELRLWLSLIIETEEKYMDIYTKPLLPNLTFKMRQGDSLVEEIAGVPLSLRGKFKYIPEMTKKRLTEIIDKKTEYFMSARLDKQKEIEDLENRLFRDIIGNEVKRIDDEIKKLEAQTMQSAKQLELIKKRAEQKELFREQAKRIKNKVENLRIEKEKFQKVLENIGKKKTKDYFLWEIDFAEIFAKKDGFDIVIGNPPYVRQERIAFPLEKEEDFKDTEEWRTRKRLYKEKLANSVRMNWGDYIKINKKSDLYIYFYYAGLSLLHSDGVFCFINSNSWLDVGYGAGLQEFLLKNMEPIYIIDNQAKRSFKESDINTVIVVIKRPKEIKDNTVKFINYKKPFEEVLTSDNLINIEKASKTKSTEDFRVFPITKKELLKDGVELPEKETLLKEPEHLPYIGNKWGGKYLRAPDVLFKILKKGKDKLVRLGDIAKVRRGFSMGNEDFFYLTDSGGTKNTRRCKNNIGWEGEIESEYLFPLFETTSQTDALLVNFSSINRRVFICNREKKQLEKTFALNYIKWGKSYLSGIGKVLKECWYKLSPNAGKILLLRSSADRQAVYYSPQAINHDQTFYSVILRSDHQNLDEELFACVLNNTLSNYFLRELESGAGKELGQGALWTAVYEAKRIPISEPTIFKSAIKSSLEEIKQILRRPSKSIFKELGLPKPNRDYSNIDPNDVNLDKVMPDRRELDRIIFEALGLTEDDQLEVYRAVVELVKNRLVKARSV